MTAVQMGTPESDTTGLDISLERTQRPFFLGYIPTIREELLSTIFLLLQITIKVNDFLIIIFWSVLSAKYSG